MAVRWTDLLGDNWFAMALVVVAACLAAGDFLATLFSVVYQRYWYDRARRPRYEPGYTPSCAIVVPCKGRMKNLAENARTFVNLDYPAYHVYFVVESDSDAAAAVLGSVVDERPGRATLVVAGLAAHCAQKNHNLLAAVRRVNDAEVLVFADADIGPNGNWLRELVLPLSVPDISVSTGFRWLMAVRPGVGALLHNYMNIFVYILMSVATVVGGVGAWGGSMAMRRRDFDEMGIAELWKKTVVDDISLSSRVRAMGRRTVVVPGAVTTTDDAIETVSGGITWFARQIMFLKAYHRRVWMYGAAPIALSGAAIILWLPLAVLASVAGDRTFLALGGAAPLLLFAGEAATALLYPLLGEVPRFGRFLALQPLLRSVQVVSYVRTMFTNVVTWSGVRYHVDRKGIVTRVERFEQ